MLTADKAPWTGLRITTEVVSVQSAPALTDVLKCAAQWETPAPSHSGAPGT